MDQQDLNREVARVTGESVVTIGSMGFVPLTTIPIEREPETVDWDLLAVLPVLSRKSRTPRHLHPP